MLNIAAICAGFALGMAFRYLTGSGSTSGQDQRFQRISLLAPKELPFVRSSAETSTHRALRDLNSVLMDYVGAGRHPREDWRMRSAVYTLPEQALPEALKLMLSQPNLDLEFALEHLFSRWAEVAPAAALQAGESLRSRHLRGLAAYQTLGTWAVLDPDEAFAYVEKEGIAHHHADDMWGMLAQANPTLALERAASIEDRQKRIRWIDRAIHMLAISDPEEAANWTLKNRSGDALVEGMQTIVSNWGRRSSPKDALDYLLSLPAEFQSERTFRELGRSISLNDYNAGIELAKFLSESENAMFLSGMARGAALHDPAKAAALAESLSEGAAREQALSIVAREMGRKRCSPSLCMAQGASARKLA